MQIWDAARSSNPASAAASPTKPTVQPLPMAPNSRRPNRNLLPLTESRGSSFQTNSSISVCTVAGPAARASSTGISTSLRFTIASHPRPSRIPVVSIYRLPRWSWGGSLPFILISCCTRPRIHRRIFLPILGYDRRGANCRNTCLEQDLHCQESFLTKGNTCAFLMEHFPGQCSHGCSTIMDFPSSPGVVVSEASPLAQQLKPSTCFLNGGRTDPAPQQWIQGHCASSECLDCDAFHLDVQRLCICFDV